jgi:hypothetical protein
MASSKYKGVSWDKQAKKWKASISDNMKKTSLGRYDSEYEAHLAYEKKKAEIRPYIKVDDLDGEIWVKNRRLGCNYLVSNKGRIKSVNYNKTGNEHIMALALSDNG